MANNGTDDHLRRFEICARSACSMAGVKAMLRTLAAATHVHVPVAGRATTGRRMQQRLAVANRAAIAGTSELLPRRSGTYAERRCPRHASDADPERPPDATTTRIGNSGCTPTPQRDEIPNSGDPVSPETASVHSGRSRP